MALTPGERFRMVRTLAGEIDDDDVWPVVDIDILLQQFGLEAMALDNWHARAHEFSRIVGAAGDDALLGIYATVMDVPDDEARHAASIPDDHGLWTVGQVRVFLSHSSAYKDFVGDVSRELAVVGVHGFVAQDSIHIEKPWQSQIEIALRTAEAFVGLVHPEFNQSSWCQQEVGWVKARGIPEYFIRLGDHPHAFAASMQWPSLLDRSAKDVAMDILSWLQQSTELTDRVVEGLMNALRHAGDYYSAAAAAKRIAALGGLSDSAWALLDAAYLANDQVHGGVLPTRVLRPFYEDNKRTFPPGTPEPARREPLHDPWASPGASKDEPPF